MMLCELHSSLADGWALNCASVGAVTDIPTCKERVIDKPIFTKDGQDVVGWLTCDAHTTQDRRQPYLHVGKLDFVNAYENQHLAAERKEEMNAFPAREPAPPNSEDVLNELRSNLEKKRVGEVIKESQPGERDGDPRTMHIGMMRTLTATNSLLGSSTQGQRSANSFGMEWETEVPVKDSSYHPGQDDAISRKKWKDSTKTLKMPVAPWDALSVTTANQGFRDKKEREKIHSESTFVQRTSQNNGLKVRIGVGMHEKATAYASDATFTLDKGFNTQNSAITPLVKHPPVSEVVAYSEKIASLPPETPAAEWVRLSNRVPDCICEQALVGVALDLKPEKPSANYAPRGVRAGLPELEVIMAAPLSTASETASMKHEQDLVVQERIGKSGGDFVQLVDIVLPAGAKDKIATKKSVNFGDEQKTYVTNRFREWDTKREIEASRNREVQQLAPIQTKKLRKKPIVLPPKYELANNQRPKPDSDESLLTTVRGGNDGKVNRRWGVEG